MNEYLSQKNLFNDLMIFWKQFAALYLYFALLKEVEGSLVYVEKVCGILKDQYF